MVMTKRKRSSRTSSKPAAAVDYSATMVVKGEDDVVATASTIADDGADDTADDTSRQKPTKRRPATTDGLITQKHEEGGGGGGGGESSGDEEAAGNEDVGSGNDGGPSESGEKRKRKRNRTRKKKPPQQQQHQEQQEPHRGADAAAEDDDEEGTTSAFATGITDTVYVEGIPWTCDENDVREFFKPCGKITGVRMPRWQDSGRPRGYAHVSFAGAGGARKAFGLDGQYLKGRYLTVQAPQEPATHKARRANRMAEQPRGCRTVFVKNLPYDADEDGVSEALAGCGRIASVRLAMWNHTRKLKGFGYVEFVTERGAETCVRTQEKLSVGGRPIVIDFETGAPKGSFRRQDGAQIKKTSADAGVGKGKAPKFKVHVKSEGRL